MGKYEIRGKVKVYECDKQNDHGPQEKMTAVLQ